VPGEDQLRPILEDVMAKRRSREGTCSVEGCGTPALAKGLCNRHYKLMRRHGDPAWQKPPRATCAAPGCNLPARAKGYCNAHLMRFQRYGDPLGERPRKLPETKPGMLTAEQVRIIQQRRGSASPAELATEFGTTVRTVIAICAGRNWGWLAK
jgi:hypothetical protein